MRLIHPKHFAVSKLLGYGIGQKISGKSNPNFDSEVKVAEWIIVTVRKWLNGLL